MYTQRALALSIVASFAAFTPSANAIPDAARIARETALQACASALWKEAVAGADEAVRLAPEWPEAYFTRAGARAGAAGEPSKVASLQTARRNVDYAALATLLEGAATDLETYLKLHGKPATQAEVSAIADLKLRASLARKNIALARELQAVVFAPRDGAYTISAAAGDHKTACPGRVSSSVPCSLYLEPGSARVRIGGDARLERIITVPAGRTTVNIKPDRRHGFGIIGGSVLAVGAGLVYLGTTTDNEIAQVFGYVYGGIGIGTGAGFLIADGVRTRGALEGIPSSKAQNEGAPEGTRVTIVPLPDGAIAAAGIEF